MQERPENNGCQDKGPEQHPNGVAAGVSGLRVAHYVAYAARTAGDAVHGAIDYTRVYNFPEDVAGEPDQRADDERLINLIDVIFVVAKLWQAFGLAFFYVAAVHAPGNE